LINRLIGPYTKIRTLSELRLGETKWNPTPDWAWLGSANADSVGEFLNAMFGPLPPTPTPKMGAGEPEPSKSLSQDWERDLGRGQS